MRRPLTLLLLMACYCMAIAQAPDTSFWRQQWQQRLRLDRTHGVILGSWGLANVATGIVGASTTTGTSRYFHQMNMGWGIVNTGLAFFIRQKGRQDETHQASIADIRKAQQRVEGLLLLNTGLDVGYVALGWGLTQRANSLEAGKARDRAKGFGESLLVQGGFLLLFDVWQYARHRRQGKAILRHDEERWTVLPTANGIGLVYRW